MVEVASSPAEHFLFRANTLSEFCNITQLIVKRMTSDEGEEAEEAEDALC